MPRLVPPLLDPRSGALTLPELCAAALDGEVHRLGQAFHPIDLPVLAEARAASIAHGLPPGAALDRDSAAWVHGALREAPQRPTACFDLRRRSRPPASSPHRFREVAALDSGVEAVGGVLVTTPLRTALDLLRADEEPDAPHRAAIRLLLLPRGGAACLRAVLARAGRLPHKRRALARVDRIYGAGRGSAGA